MQSPPEAAGIELGRLVVFTCITGGYDIPLESPWALRCPHVCFTDDPHLRSATWTMRPLDGENLDAARRSRLPKILPHRYLADYDTCIWIDASARLLEDPVALARRALDGADFAAPRHWERDCAYEEIERCILRGRDDPELMRRQGDAYRTAGFPAHAGLWEGAVLVRRHHAPALRDAMDEWWAQVAQGSRRDQVSLAYVVWRRQFPILTLPGRYEPGAFYKVRKHHVHRSASRRAKIQVTECLRRARTRLRRLFG